MQRQLRHSLQLLQLLEKKQRSQPCMGQGHSLHQGTLPQPSKCERKLLQPAVVASHTRQQSHRARMLRLNGSRLPHSITFLSARVKAKGAHRPMAPQPPSGPVLRSTACPTRSRNSYLREAARSSRSSMCSHQQAAPWQHRLELLAQVLTCLRSSSIPRAQQRPRLRPLDCNLRPQQLQLLLRKRPQPLLQRLVKSRKRQPQKRAVLRPRLHEVPPRPHPCAIGQRLRRLSPCLATTPWHKQRPATHPPAASALTALRSRRLCSSCSSTTPSTRCS